MHILKYHSIIRLTYVQINCIYALSQRLLTDLTIAFENYQRQDCMGYAFRAKIGLSVPFLTLAAKTTRIHL